VKPPIRLHPIDLLILKRLGRLARSTRDLLNLLDLVAAQARAGFRSVKDTWADTTKAKEWSES
jgi:DNA invertase Pin-like site-specific DNA recombinase